MKKVNEVKEREVALTIEMTNGMMLANIGA